MIERLERIADLEYDVLAPGQFMVAAHPITNTPAHTRQRLAGIISRL